ncbi:MAG: hypothetical protein WC966_10685 [Bradymonadales bacterium]
MTKYKATIYGSKGIGKVEINNLFDSLAEARIAVNQWCADLLRHGAHMVVETVETEEEE